MCQSKIILKSYIKHQTAPTRAPNRRYGPHPGSKITLSIGEARWAWYRRVVVVSGEGGPSWVDPGQARSGEQQEA